MPRMALLVGAALFLCGVLPGAAQAVGYPSKTVRLILPFPAGGSTDVLGRLLSKKMSESWGQPVVVDNRPGAGGAIAAELAARALPDGHTVFLGTIGDMAVSIPA